MDCTNDTTIAGTAVLGAMLGFFFEKEAKGAKPSAPRVADSFEDETLVPSGPESLALRPVINPF